MANLVFPAEADGIRPYRAIWHRHAAVYRIEARGARMAEYTVKVDEKYLPYIEAFAKLRGITVEEAISTMITEQLLKRVSERAAGFEGLFDGPEDLSEREEEIMYGKHQGD